MSEELAKAKDKISKLLNMTVENGCSEDEQDTALKMAAAIATRVGIELDSIRAATGTAAQRKAVSKTLRQELKVHQVLAAQAAAALYGCELYTYDHGKGGILFVGREENIELSEQTMFWLMRQVELLYKQSLPRGLSQSVRAEFRKTFKAACALRVYERARQMMYEMRTNPAKAQEATGQNALVVQGYFDTLRKENAAYFQPTEEEKERTARYIKDREEREANRRNAMTVAEREAEDLAAERQRKREEKKAAKRKGPRARTIPVGNGTSAGRMAGDTVQLRKEIR